MSFLQHLSEIPRDARIVIRVTDGIDDISGKMQYRDFVGHVISSDDNAVVLLRDASANGKRSSEIVRIPVATIHRLKPVPERKNIIPSAQETSR